MVAADLGRALVVFGLIFAPKLATVLALVFVRGGIQNAALLMGPPGGAVLAELWGVGFVFTAAGIALALLGLAVFFLRPAVAMAAMKLPPNTLLLRNCHCGGGSR